ncbi:hypothetical protein J4232_02625 [Candidatus Woesearchaeota archaeon]|nr:hypothetical protein [Candidatus Woesearchaeota archaeon]
MKRKTNLIDFFALHCDAKKYKKKKSQIALELILLMSLAMLLLFPSMALFSNFVQESSREIVETQVKQIGTSMIEQTQSMFYYGNGSVIVVEYKFPERVRRMKINAYPENNYYEIAFDLDLPGDISKAYISKIPIAAAKDDKSGTIIKTGKFPENAYSTGKKKFKIQNNGNYVIIAYIEPKVD